MVPNSSTGCFAPTKTAPTCPGTPLFVSGPFLAPDRQHAFQQRAEALSRVEWLTFDSHIEVLMERAQGVLAMGGYNTFCEILSLDKPALLLPRSVPRREQLIRAREAERLGLVRMLPPDGDRSAATMIRALRQLPDQALPSTADIPGLLDGLDTVVDQVERMLKRFEAPGVAGVGA